MLKEAREKSGLTQEELARRVKTTKSAISRIENHSDDIKLSTLIKVAKSLGRQLSVKILWDHFTARNGRLQAALRARKLRAVLGLRHILLREYATQNVL